MDGDFIVGATIGALFTALVFIVIIGAADDHVTRKWQKAAVAHGAAHFILDPTTGASKWEWKEKDKGVEK